MSDDKKVSKPVAQKEPPKKQTVMYLGESFFEKTRDGDITIHIKYGQIFNNGLPKEIKELCKTNKDFAMLFVPVGDVSTVMKEMKKPDNRYNECKRNIREQAFQKNKKRRGRNV